MQGEPPGLWQRRLKLLVLSAFVAIALSLATLTNAWLLNELRSFDYLSTIDTPAPPEDGPIIVAIDEPSMAEIGRQWPWPRALHARLIEALRKAGARAIGVDVIFAEPSTNPANDDDLEKALGPDVVLAGDQTFIPEPQADQFVRTEPLARFIAKGARTGIASVNLSGDGTLRAVPDYPDGFAAALAEIAGTRTQSPPDDALIQVFGPARTYPTVSYYQALDPDNFLPEGIFADRVVLVGLSLQNAPSIADGGADAFTTSDTVHSNRLVSGVEMQATIYDNLANNLFIERAPRPVVVAAIALAAVLAAFSVLRMTGWRTLVYGVVAVTLIVLASYAAMRLGHIFVSPLGPGLAFLAVTAGQAALDYAEERKRRREITRAFEQYLSPALVERLAKDPSHLRLGGERRTLSILFCDIRGFTTIAEEMKDDPERLTALVNRLLTPLSEAVLEQGGTIDKYIGDCLMAFWNAPLDDPDHAVHAVRAALDMLARLERVNGELEIEAKREGRPVQSLRIGIGVNTGECIVGNMGSHRRFDYSALGDAVNLASRLEGASKDYGISLLIGEETARLAGKAFPVAELDRITVKGRSAVSPVFTVAVGAKKEALDRHRAFVQAKYDGALRVHDVIFDQLKGTLPPLARYYERERSRLDTSRREPK
ncbi:MULTISPECIES: CHASE2 domain-containing protein [unclassified Ensifer]|uniref:CHASE2 domain-containing protein n=1 Tax=unclassified Ensifer TaxID=2633371 RepID=UPI00081359AF|nr:MULTISPECIES: CHASE2 domain-containing protein [unclassified Ensifer]OCP02833.1 adenylate cyclase [Ensifer sp. LC14]OCP13734.1 adenylate cyclase [Ensifer sp. LC13]OCP14394.1 adenylate cyclase [Ensifer sp. LC11]OCP29097.1 adenylate cyclase [Ensifer sp. LC499]